MEIDYYIEKEDVIEGSIYILENSKHQQKLNKYVANIVSIGLGAIIISIILIYSGSWFFCIPWFILTVIISLVMNKNQKQFISKSKLSSYFVKKNIEGILKEGKNKGILGWHNININENGFNESTNVNSNFHNWQGVEKVEENEKYIFIYITATNAHLIPKRAFNNNQNAIEFYNLAKTYHNRTLPYINLNYLGDKK